MKKKSLLLFALITVLGVSLSGCSLVPSFTMSKTVRPPRLEGEKQALQLAFEKSAGEKITLKSPSKGSYLSSFVLYDINGDGNDEAFVFYSSNSADATVRVNILQKIKDDWVSVADLKGSGNAVYEIEFIDANIDGKSEIIISWSLFDNKTTRIVSVIDFTVSEDGRLIFTAKANEYFTYKELIDFDLDGFYELCVLFIDDTEQAPKSFLRVFNFTENNTVKLSSELFLDNNIVAVSKSHKDIVSKNKKDSTRLFLDVMRNEVGLFTEVLVWSMTENKLIRELEKPLADTFRKAVIHSRDIDNDGYYEIPVITELIGRRQKQLISGSEETNDALYIEMLKWLSVENGRLKQDMLTIYNPSDLYFFKANWKANSITARYDEKLNEVVFSEWNEKSEKYGNDLFSLKFSGDVTKAITEYTLVASGEKGNYWCKIYPAAKNHSITVEYISKNLILL